MPGLYTTYCMSFQFALFSIIIPQTNFTDYTVVCQQMFFDDKNHTKSALFIHCFKFYYEA